MKHQQEEQAVYTIYNSPADWPGEYVIKRWIMSASQESINDPGQMNPDLTYIFNALTLKACRQELQEKGLTNLGREESDDPVIVESWI